MTSSSGTTRCKGLILRDHEVRRLLDAGSVTVVREVTKLPRARETWEAHSMRRCLYGDGWSWHDENGNCHNCDWTVRCPIGREGEQRWVRETWRVSGSGRHYPTQATNIYVEWREQSISRGAQRGRQHQHAWTVSDDESDRLMRTAYGSQRYGTWRPSSQMPRWASRAVVEVASVRVARVRDLTEADAIAAGVEGWQTTDGRGHFVSATAREVLVDRVARQATGSVDGTPWVWVASVSRVEVSG